MTENLLAGLSIALAGLIIVFLALGLFALVINLLGKIFAEKEPAQEQAASDVQETPSDSVLAVESDPSDDLPVVIATAISYFRAHANNTLGAALEEGKSGWWAMNRMNARQGTGIRIKRSGR